MTDTNYVVVEPATKHIIGGPYAWDGTTEWTAPEIAANPNAGYELLMVQAAADQRYTQPAPLSPWMVVDAAGDNVDGPYMWDGVSEPAPAVLAAGESWQQL